MLVYKSEPLFTTISITRLRIKEADSLKWHNFPTALSYFVRVFPTSFFYQYLIILLRRCRCQYPFFRIQIVVRSKVFEKKKTEKKNQSKKAPQQFLPNPVSNFFQPIDFAHEKRFIESGIPKIWSVALKSNPVKIIQNIQLNKVGFEKNWVRECLQE